MTAIDGFTIQVINEIEIDQKQNDSQWILTVQVFDRIRYDSSTISFINIIKKYQKFWSKRIKS